MDLEKRYIQLREFILKHKEFLDQEILQLYPASHKKAYIEMIDNYQLSKSEDLIKIENLQVPNQANESLKEYISELTNLTTLSSHPESQINIEKNHLHQIGEKKQHEIMQIESFLRNIRASSILDLCSGKAHLSQILSLRRKEPIYAYDFDEKLQQSGKRVFNKYFTNSPNKNLTFIKADLSKPIELVDRDSLLIGLHACGDLSANIIAHHLKGNKLLSIGCCYHKIKNYQNMSRLSKQRVVDLSFQALSLANKSNRVMNKSDWDRRLKVKTYRYIIEMISIDHNLRLERINQVPFDLYNQDFASYAKHLTSAKLDFNTLFHDYEQSSLLNDYLKLEVLRVPAGRAIELFLILDRAIFLKENGFNVQLCEIFNKSISPRNIAIFVCK